MLSALSVDDQAPHSDVIQHYSSEMQEAEVLHPPQLLWQRVWQAAETDQSLLWWTGRAWEQNLKKNPIINCWYILIISIKLFKM